MLTTPVVELSTSPEDQFVSTFQMMEGHTLNGSNATIQGIRKDAIEHFRTLGIPDRKNEAWKYTNIEKVLRHSFKLQPPAKQVKCSLQDIEPFLVPGLDAHLVVLVNGRFDENLSSIGTLPDGVIVSGFAHASETYEEIVNRHYAKYADYRSEPFTALNTAFTRDGVFVYVPRNRVVDRPIHILSVISTDEDLLIQPRMLFVIEDNAQVRIIESGHSLTHTRTLTNSVTEIFVGESAFVDHYKIQREGDEAVQINNLQVYQEANSFMTTDTITLGGGLVRNNLNFLPNAEHCETHLYGLFLGKGNMHVDTHTLVDHARPNCVSDETYKGILDDSSTGVFNGKVYVRPDAQQTNAYQSNRSILLTDTAHMYSKPELEIYADDVRCSHGATTGQLDREAVFYLRSRGITEQQAIALLLLAFARDVLEHVNIEPLRENLDTLIKNQFHAEGV